MQRRECHFKYDNLGKVTEMDAEPLASPDAERFTTDCAGVQKVMREANIVQRKGRLDAKRAMVSHGQCFFPSFFLACELTSFKFHFHGLHALPLVCLGLFMQLIEREEERWKNIEDQQKLDDERWTEIRRNGERYRTNNASAVQPYH